MKHSLRFKSTLLFIGLMSTILIISWGVNRWYLGTYYITQKQNTLKEAYGDIDQFLQETDVYSETFVTTWLQFCDKYNITMLMLNSNGVSVFSNSEDSDKLKMKLSLYLVNEKSPNEDWDILYKEDKYQILKTYNHRLNSEYLESWGFISDNWLFIMTTPLASIQESTEISNQFLAYIGIVALFISGICTFFATKTITKPILHLASISEKMSNLNFEVKYVESSSSEIDALGNSMNKLSEKLERTISELQLANNQLQKDIEEKTKIDEMRKEFLSNVSHELKTPIALIQGYAEGLSEGIIDDEENRRYYCEVIMDESDKMNKIVKQLLNLNQLESGSNAISMERFDLTELIQGVLNAANILIQQKGVTIRFDDPGTLFVKADEFKIEEVITNYLSNALNHVDGEKIIEIKVTKENQLARISVYNTGMAIPESDLEHVWTKFYKVDKARTREYGGSGVGLSIVQAIMEAHHKLFGVQNRNEGVEFWFELACSDE